ncbi:NPC intracellular cholesterol transporter 2-like [Schistocerca nitens]|uniref:NPC intracellular cholesterol transporter 2-like n=1 Tax=Schistocerca nitens TaxID=7011 RepID=UPI002118D55D|nr:NPC intracellular cholesterol transporter 2-like [Schistocerca nitens]
MRAAAAWTAFRLLLLVSTASATTVQTCETGTPPVSVDILDCDVPPCVFYRGESMSGNITFVTERATTSLRPDVLANIGGVEVNYQLPQQDACQSLVSGSCPLQAGQTAVYSLVINILEMYPKVNLTVQLSLVDESEAVVTCFLVDGEVTDRNPPQARLRQHQRRIRPMPSLLPRIPYRRLH